MSWPEVPIYKLLDDYAKIKPEFPLLIYEDKKVYTYSKISEDSSRFSAALWDLGIRKADAVAIIMFNRPEFISAFFGISKTGARSAIIDPLTTSEDLRYQLELSGPKAIITDSEIWEREKSILESVEAERYIVVEGEGRGIANYEEFLTKYKPQPPEVEIDPTEDIAISVHYAGIIGRTYEVYHTHQNLIACTFTASMIEGLEEGSHSLIAIPLSHLFGFITLIQSIVSKSGIVLMRRFDLEKALELIKEFNIYYWPGPPAMFSAAVDGLKKESFPSLKLCLTGAAPVPPELQKIYFEEIGIPLIQVYGFTEGLLITIQPPSSRIYGSVGTPLPGVEIKIVDKETGTKELPVGEVGELIAKAQWIMKGYGSRGKIDFEETNRAIRNGWIFSGDLLTMDKTGFLYFRGLKKRFLKYKAYPIFPRDLEIVLQRHPSVKEVFVDGEWEPEIGHKLFAKVVLKPEYKGEVSEEELMNFVNQRVAFYKKLRKIVFVDRIE